MTKKLTVNSVKTIKATLSRREISDELVPRLRLIVQPSGAKSWAIRYRFRGAPRKHTLGPFPALDLNAARSVAREALQVVDAGGDPASAKRAAKEEAKTGSNLVENVIAEFLKRHRTRRGEVPRSLPELRRMLEHDVVPVWEGRLIQDIKKRDVIELLDGLIDRGVGAMTNRVLAVVRLFFNWAVSRDIIEVSPCAGIRPPAAETPRDRVLSHDEIRLFWKACDVAGYPFGAAFKLLLISGQRLSEVAEALWPEIDLERHLWSLPKERVKNKRDHNVPLSDLAIEILEDIPRIAGLHRFLFTTTGETPISGFGRAKRNLDKAIADEVAKHGGGPVPPFTLHDLRRTVATELQKLNVPPHVAEAILNHRSGVISGVAAIYARHDFAAEKRAALDAWARRLAAIVEERSVDNVVPLYAGGIAP